MSYTGPKPLPRFALPDDSVDPSEVSQTNERPALVARRVVVRKKATTLAPPAPESTEEVALEDILLETYIDEPQRSAPPAPHTLKMLPPSIADDRAVDELLMMTPSVAPVMMPTPVPPPIAPPRSSHAAAFIVTALLLVGVVAGIGAMLAIPRGLLARASAATNAPSPRAATVIAAKSVEPVTSTVSVDALPASSPAIESGMTWVTFPREAKGHRVYVDDAVIGDGGERAKIKCGRRSIRIGSHGKARELDLPCGREIVFE